MDTKMIPIPVPNLACFFMVTAYHRCVNVNLITGPEPLM